MHEPGPHAQPARPRRRRPARPRAARPRRWPPAWCRGRSARRPRARSCVPPSYNGVYGFKPSYGAIPRTGMLKTTDTLDTVGVLSRHPADLRVLLEALARARLQLPVDRALARRSPRHVAARAAARRAAGRGPRRAMLWNGVDVDARAALGRGRGAARTPPAPRSSPLVLPRRAAARAHRARDDLRARAGVLLQRRVRAARDPVGELPRHARARAGRLAATSTPRRSTTRRRCGARSTPGSRTTTPS